MLYKTAQTILVMLLILCVVGIVFAGYDASPRPKASPDLAEFIIQVPAGTYEKHGYSERTDIMYNLARFRELYMDSAKQVQMLKDRVAKLEETVNKLVKPPAPIIVSDPNVPK